MPTLTRELAARYYIAALVNYIWGLVIWLPQIFSLYFSLQMVYLGIISRKRTTVIVLATLEMVTWFFFPCFVWYFQVKYECPTEYYYYYSCYQVTWYGWIAIVLNYFAMIFFGIHRILILQNFDGIPAPSHELNPLPQYNEIAKTAVPRPGTY